MVFPPPPPQENPGYRRYDKGVSVIWDLRPESILPAKFISKTDDSEGTELCQASWLPGPTPQHTRPGRMIRYPGPKTVRRDIIPGHRTCRDRFQDNSPGRGVSPWCCRVLKKGLFPLPSVSRNRAHPGPAGRPGFRGYPPGHRPGGRRPRGRRGETTSRYCLSGQGGPLRLPCSAGPGPLPR